MNKLDVIPKIFLFIHGEIHEKISIVMGENNR